MPRVKRFTVRTKLWQWDGPAAWHFVTLPKALSGRIERLANTRRSPFGSIRVWATIGRTSWETSVFPDRKAGAFLLPVKSDVRRKESIALGDAVRLTIELAPATAGKGR
jgi:hypothetical protein